MDSTTDRTRRKDRGSVGKRGGGRKKGKRGAGGRIIEGSGGREGKRGGKRNGIKERG